jgi:hypothetical protein
MGTNSHEKSATGQIFVVTVFLILVILVTPKLVDYEESVHAGTDNDVTSLIEYEISQLEDDGIIHLNGSLSSEILVSELKRANVPIPAPSIEGNNYYLNFVTGAVVSKSIQEENDILIK